jgi:hypothetical protein
MTELHAKPIIDKKFWIVEQNGIQCATLRKNDDNRFVMSNESGVEIFNNEKSVLDRFGKDFFVSKKIENAEPELLEVHGYPTSTKPHNAMFDVRKRLPLFTKSKESKSLYCAGYYLIRFDKGWVKSFCPKLITLQRYDFKGPYKTELEMKTELSNVPK